eukprot:2224899-Prymnesium_polylepis.1
MAATPDAFRGALPGTLRPEHPPANPEPTAWHKARGVRSPDIRCVHQHMHANARRAHRAAADASNR